MTIVYWLLAIQGIIGAFDTLYYHEWRTQLVAGGSATSPELKLHAARDFLYAVLFGSLPWLKWQGFWAIFLGIILLLEIILTFGDFVVERRVRKPMGDVDGGERVTHAAMGIIYGAMLAHLIPELLRWYKLPTVFNSSDITSLYLLRWGLSLMAIGVFLSGIRDMYAALGLPHGGWPWKKINKDEKS